MPKCLLIIDPVPTNRIRLAAMFETAQYEVSTAGTDSDLASLASAKPDLLVIGLHNNPPLPVIRYIHAQGIPKETPIVCLDTVASPERRMQALSAGAREFMQRKTPDNLLLARVRGLLREGDAEQECERRRMAATSFGFADSHTDFTVAERVAFVLGPGVADELKQVLARSVPGELDVLGVQDALSETWESGPPSAYVIAPGLNDETLETVLPELRARGHSRHAPVLVIHDNARPELALRALNLGASDIAADTSTGGELAIRIKAMLRHKRLRDRLRQTDEQSYRLAATDPLTGLYNRRYAEAYLADLLMRAEELGRGYVLMLVDLDHFKAINDTFGHGAGDHVLKSVADRLRDNLRVGDLVARYGGEEFLIVLPDASTSEGEFTAERLRKAISGLPVVLDDGVSVKVTASIGVGFSPEHSLQKIIPKTGTYDMGEPACPMSLSRLVDAADAALYRAKSGGRNRVEFSVS